MKFVYMLLICWQAVAAENLIEVNLAGVSTSDQEPIARTEITRDVLDKTAKRYILDLIGEKKFSTNKQAVQNIIKQADKFVPFVKGGELKKTPEGYEMWVNLKLSLSNLNELLTKAGLLYESNAAAVVLPFVLLTDLEGTRYAWWAHGSDPSRSLLIGFEKWLETSLRNEFNKKNFYVIKPATSGLFETVPQSMRNEAFRTEDATSIAEYHKAQMVLIGQVNFSSSTRVGGGYKAAMKLGAYYAQTGRFVGEVARTVELEPGSIQASANKRLPQAFDDLARDLSLQVFDAWQKGTFGAELLKLNVTAQFNAQELELFKSNITSAVPQVKTVRERMFEPGRITFEVDASGSATDLANRLKSAKLPGFELNVADVGVDNLSVTVKSR